MSDAKKINTLLAGLFHPGLKQIDMGLERVEEFLARLGSPQNHLPPVIHVAGTNGKGSLIAYLQAIFEAAGYRVHRYISPHLVRFNERISISGRDIGDAELLALLEEVSPQVAQCPVTFFESTTAMTLLAFTRHKADVVLLETGMGGRLDATNVVARPRLTAITPVGMDHMEFLGGDLASIAAEKAGILKPDVTCVVGPQREEALRVIMERAAVVGAPLIRHAADWQVKAHEAGMQYHSARGDGLLPRPALVGAHQMNNAATAVACIEQLSEFSITAEHIAVGLRACQWPARLQRITHNTYAALLPSHAELWLDGGHNADAGQVLAAWVKQHSRPVHLVCGMMARKDVRGFLQPLAECASSLVAIAVPDEEDSCSAEEICNVAARLGMCAASAPSPREALAHIARDVGDESYAVLICGSLYLAGKILSAGE